LAFRCAIYLKGTTMPSKGKQKSKPFIAQLAELSIAVPQVVAHRLTRMALAGPVPVARDRREFHQMGSEKFSAFYESWNAMFSHVLRAQYEFSISALQSLWLPWTGAATYDKLAQSYLESVTHGVLGAGIAPVRRRAVANAQRLGRSRFR
jgi:hypothetical protein